MSKEFASDQKERVRRREPPDKGPAKERPAGRAPRGAALLRLQRLAGNRAVQRLLQRHGGEEGSELDEATAGRVNRARGGGQPLESDLQAQMGETMGYDFSGVRVHTGPESDDLNRQLSARAFTTGQDIFLRSGEYNPASSGGRELIAHELSHVVQQGTGRVQGSGGGMTVRPAGDAFEQEADALARRAAGAGHGVATRVAEGGTTQRQEIPEEEEIQTQPLAQRQVLQHQEVPEEEEIQTQPLAQRQVLQHQEVPEEEEIQAQPLAQRQVLQHQEVPEEEEVRA